MRRASAIVTLGVAAAAMFAPGCRREPRRTLEVVVAPAARLPAEPGDPAWDKAPEHLAKLLLQDLVEPRQMDATTPEVLVRALGSGGAVAFRLEWPDASRSDLPGPAKFIDACAVQFPARLEKDPPAPQMGEAGRAVEVTYWRADWQALASGRGGTIKELYPNASIDHYPFDAPALEKGSAAQQEMAARYSPAQASGNLRSSVRQSAVEDLVADGPGTLRPAEPRGSQGKGVHSKKGWSVVLSRRLPAGLAPKTRTQVAFAVWEGSHQEAGARKMRTGWIPLLLQGAQ
jgi:DMSO reductase family type II enzyme heme b subunit